MNSEMEIQREYYASTAQMYEQMHVAATKRDGHSFSLSILVGLIDLFDIETILDVGAGTGRAMRFLKKWFPHKVIRGVEPVGELRDEAYSLGVSEQDLTAGDATDLQFADGEFDLVCEFGVLHHIREPQDAICEMARVSNKAVFISDSNNFGQGSFLARTAKQVLNSLHLWGLANLTKTKGRGYTVSQGDGLAYSYSVFSNYALLKKLFQSVHIMNTIDGGINPYRTASHLAVFGVKSDEDRVAGPSSNNAR